MNQDDPANQKAPLFQRYMNPIIEVLAARSGPMSNDDLDAAAVGKMGLDSRLLAVLHDPEKGDTSEVSYRMAWARTYLKKVGILSNPARAQWQLTDRGRELGRIDPDDVFRQVRAGADTEVSFGSASYCATAATETHPSNTPARVPELRFDAWRTKLLSVNPSSSSTNPQTVASELLVYEDEQLSAYYTRFFHGIRVPRS